MKTSAWFALLFACVLLCSTTTGIQAGTIASDAVPTITVSQGDTPGGPKWEWSPAQNQLMDLPGRGKGIDKALDIIGQLGGSSVEVSELEFDPDPFVLNNTLITNNTGITQIYTVGIALPTSFPAANLISGNVRADVIDGGGAAGATLAAVGAFPIYDAEIDFSSVATLLGPGTSIVAGAGLSNSMSASFGPSVSAIPVTAAMGIQLRFSLSAGDTASVLSRFDITAVPEPSSLAWCAVSLLGLAARWRR